MAIPTVIKQPSESRLYTMEFAALLGTDETILSVSSTAVTPVTDPTLSLSGTVFSDTIVQFRLSSGLTGKRYKVTIVVTTSAGNTIEGEGFVQSEDL
jgi:hypothetical protein